MIKHKLCQENISKYLRICDAFRTGHISSEDDNETFNELLAFLKERYSYLKSDYDFIESSLKARTELFSAMFQISGDLKDSKIKKVVFEGKSYDLKETVAMDGVHEYFRDEKGIYHIGKEGEQYFFLHITEDGLVSETIDHQNNIMICDQ